MTLDIFLLIVSMIAFCHFLLSANRAASQDLFMKKMTYWYLVLTMGSTLGILIWRVIETVKIPF